MSSPLFVREDLASTPRRKLFTLLGVRWEATPRAWQHLVGLLVVGITAAILIRPVDGLVLQIGVGLLYGLIIEASYALHNVGHTLSGRLAGSPMQANLITATRMVNLYDESREQPRRVHLLRALGGPLINILAGLLIALVWWIAGPNHWLEFAAAANLVYGVGALAPIRSLDGGVIFERFLPRP